MSLEEFIKKNENFELIKNMSITTSTIDAKIDGLYFNEKELTNEFMQNLKNTCDNIILKFSSNYLNPPITSKFYEQILYNKTVEKNKLLEEESNKKNVTVSKVNKPFGYGYNKDEDYISNRPLYNDDSNKVNVGKIVF